MDIHQAAVKSLWSKMGMKTIDLAEFGRVIVKPCGFCGAKPTQELTYTRKDEGTYVLHWNYPMMNMNGELRCLCHMCKKLLVNYSARKIVSYCARVMARRLHGKLKEWVAI